MKSEFLKSELELYVQRLLIYESYATGHQYKMLKISPIDERLKGYDAEIVGMTSFYCQFKTSNSLTQDSTYKKRQDFCATVGWPKAPFHSFALRVPMVQLSLFKNFTKLNKNYRYLRKITQLSIKHSKQQSISIDAVDL